MAEETPPCVHDGEFGVTVAIARMEDTGRFSADIRVQCARCGEPFRFLGVSPGVSWRRPMVSADGLELRAPIEPQGEPRLFVRSAVEMPPELGPVRGNA